MSRIIRIEKCEYCPYFDHTGRLGPSMARPYCSKKGMIIPYDIESKLSQTISPTLGIPEFCPLESYKGPANTTDNKLVRVYKTISDYYECRKCTEDGEVYGLTMSDGYTDILQLLRFITQQGWVIWTQE